MKLTAQILSYIFHPVFIISYVLLILLLINPYLFAIQDEKTRFLLIFSVVMISLIFPMLASLMMKGLGLINSLEMQTKKERVAPMVVTGIFYLWLYVNIRSNSIIPSAFSFFVLGTTISLFIAFVLNSFTKISLHTVGMGGLLTGFILIRYFFTYETFLLHTPWINLQVHTNIILFGIVLAAGAVGSSRLYLKAHTYPQVYGGYAIGILGQLLAMRVLF